MDFMAKVFRRLYWPICRAYARFLMGDKPAGIIPRFVYSPPFWMLHRYWPNFAEPKRFSEKLWHRMLSDRDPKLTMLVDKLRVRDYVDNKVGGEHLIPLLWHGVNAEEIPFQELPQTFVMKTNHGCGCNIIVKDKNQLDIGKTIKQLKTWLNVNFCLDKFLGIEWGYKNVRPEIIIESFIGENGEAPIDYKFWCFSGRVDFVILHFDRFHGHSTKTVTRDFGPTNYAFPLDGYHGKISPPQNFNEMTRLAEKLAEDFAFMRVDLYSVNKKAYFGELTPYPNGIETNFVPEKDDILLGDKWRVIQKVSSH